MDRARPTEAQEHGDDSIGVKGWENLSPWFVRDTAARRLKALGHPDRLRIVEVLNRHPAFVADIGTQLGLSPGTVSRHLRALHAAGILERSQHGNHVLYALADRELPRVAAFAYRSAAVRARRVIESAPPPDVTATPPTEGSRDG